MSQDRINKLDSIGFVWEKQLVEYKRINGHSKVPESHPVGPWVKTQKGLKSLIGSAVISSEDKRRLDLLNKISFYSEVQMQGM
ncbi:hypothetical protein ACHAXN_000051 [Cyclotella atomus]